MEDERKGAVIREINRIFSQRFENVNPFKEHISRVVTNRLLDLKREVRDTSWKTRIMLLTEALRINPHNRDLLEKLKGKVKIVEKF